MGALCEATISDAVKALIENDKELAKKTIEAEKQIDQKEKDIEALCLKLLLQQQPVARDLRLISAALKMITDMERIGDQAADIADIVLIADLSLPTDFKDIKLDCSCYDYADMCKHVAAALYGVGAHLDEHPEDLFTLRDVNHTDLIAKASSSSLSKETSDQDTRLTGDLSSLFGIDIEGEPPSIIYLDSKVKKEPLRKKNLIQPKKISSKRAKTHIKK